MKKRIFLTVLFAVLLFIVLLGALPFVLTSQWAIRKFFLPVAEEKMQCTITTEKILFDLSDPGNRLVLSGMTLRKKAGVSGDKTIICKAEEVKINFPVKAILDFRKYGIKSLLIRNLSVTYFPQENAEGIKQTFDLVRFSGIAADNRGEFYFRTVLPLSPVHTPDKRLDSEGKGGFSLDETMALKNLYILLTGTNGREQHLETHLSVDREKDHTYKISSSIQGKNLSTMLLFSFLQMKKYEGTVFNLNSLDAKFGSLYKKREKVFLKNLSGTGMIRLGECNISPDAFVSGKLFRIMDKTFPVAEQFLNNYITMERQYLKRIKAVNRQQAEELEKSKKKLEDYRNKTLLLGKILDGDAPFVIKSGKVVLKMTKGLSVVENCTLYGNIPDEFIMNGILDTVNEKIVFLNTSGRLLDLQIPVYFKTSSWNKPAVDKDRSLKDSWQKNQLLRKNLFERLKVLQQTFGSNITLDGKKLSEITEKEAAEKAEEALKKKVKSLLKRMKKEKRKKK